jgi:hypothetical protein
MLNSNIETRFLTRVILGLTLGLGGSIAEEKVDAQESLSTKIISRNEEFRSYGIAVAQANTSDQTSPQYFSYPPEFLVPVDKKVIDTNNQHLHYKKLFIDIPTPPEWKKGNHTKKPWSHPGYKDDYEKSWTELVNRLALNYSDELNNSSNDLTKKILQDIKPFLDRDLNWRVFPRYLAKFVENGIKVEQVGKLSDFRNLYGSTNLSEEVILNLLVNQVTKEDFMREEGNVSLAIARKNENKFHSLFKEYCATNNLVYNKTKVEDFVYKELGLTKTPSLKDYRPNMLIGYSTIDGEAVFYSAINLIKLNEIKKIDNQELKVEALKSFFEKSMVFCMADQDATAQKVFEGGSGFTQLAKANREGKINLLVFKINPTSNISPQDQIPNFLKKLTEDSTARIKTLAIAAHGSPINMSLVVPYKGNRRTTNNEGSLSFDDGKIFEQIGTYLDQNKGLIHLQSCDTAGPQGQNPFGYPQNNIADFIALKTGVPVIAPAPSIRNGSYSVIQDSDGEFVPLPSYGLCTYFIDPQLNKEDHSNQRSRPVIRFIRTIFGRN